MPKTREARVGCQKLAGAAGEDHTGREADHHSRAFDLLRRSWKVFFYAGFDDVGPGRGGGSDTGGIFTVSLGGEVFIFRHFVAAGVA